MQPNALLLRQNFIIRKKGVLHDSPRWLHPAKVTFDHGEKDEHPMRINGTRPLFRDLTGPGDLGHGYGHLGYSSGSILIKSQRSQTPVHEGLH
jgi:hypothetical protein